MQYRRHDSTNLDTEDLSIEAMSRQENISINWMRRGTGKRIRKHIKSSLYKSVTSLKLIH